MQVRRKPSDLPEMRRWLVERSGSFGKFLGSVRYPPYTGKSKVSNGDQSAIIRPRNRKKV